jgi:hypothetical protein
LSLNFDHAASTLVISAYGPFPERSTILAIKVLISSELIAPGFMMITSNQNGCNSSLNELDKPSTACLVATYQELNGP